MMRRGELDDDPITQYLSWRDDAEGLFQPDAACLATAGADGQPDARMVLLRGVDAEGFRFYTNERSRKAIQLAENPLAALVVHWHEPHRQVRIRGSVSRASAEASDRYWRLRARDSQLSAWASEQSQPIDSRDELEARKAEVAARYPDEVPRPPHWGGYLLRPHELEFWEDRPGRLHDRFLYCRTDAGTWELTRMQP